MAKLPTKPTLPKKPRQGSSAAEERRPKAARHHAKAAKPRAASAEEPTRVRRTRTAKSPAPPEPARPNAPRRRKPAVRARVEGVETETRTIPRVQQAAASPLARSVAGFEEQAAGDPAAQSDDDGAAASRVMELHWDDEPPQRAEPGGVVSRWAKRGDTLLRHLAEHGVARHEVRADLREGRFVWIDPDGRVSAEAKARVLCSWSPTTSAVVMAWADPLVRASGVSRVDGMPPERDDVDEEGAWHIAMEAAEAARAEYLYRVTTPDAWYFLALSGLSFTPGRASFSPSTPVGLVLRGLAETRRAVESRAEPTDVLRERLAGLGRALVHEAEYAYRGTDWVARLERTGRRLVNLAERLPRASFKSVAAGRPIDEWLGRDTTIDLSQALRLLEDEWALFA